MEIDDLRPIVAVDANQGNQAALARLHQREDFEQFGERAEASGKRHHPSRAHRQMHLAHGEGVELEGQIGRRVGIRLLLARQLDIESDRRRTDVAGAAVDRLHDPGTAARRNDVVALTVDGRKRAPALGHDAAEATRLVIPARHARRPGGATTVAVCLPDARAAKNHDGRADAPRAQPFVGLGEFQEKAHPLHGIAENEIRVRCRQAIGGRKLLQVVIGHERPPDFTA